MNAQPCDSPPNPSPVKAIGENPPVCSRSSRSALLAILKMKTMKAIQYLPALCLLTFTGCNSTTMTVDSYDGRTGRSDRKVYSKFYDAGVWLVPNHIGMSVVVDHEKTRIPIVHGVQQSLGALGPSDSYATGKVTIYIWNGHTQALPVKILRVSSKGESVSPNQVINAQPKTRTGDAVGRLRVFGYGTEIPIRVEYELNGKRSTVALTLPRRTEDELRKYFGPNGNPPYPWYDTNSSQ